MSNKTSTKNASINCPYLNVKINNRSTIAGYIDSGATVSLLSDTSLSDKEKTNIEPFNGRVTDANGKPIPIAGSLPIKFELQSKTVTTKILIFRKNEAIAHDLLIGMNILKFATLDFVNKKIHFSHANHNSTPSNNCTHDWLTLRVQTCQIHYPSSASKSTPVRLLHITDPHEVNPAAAAAHSETGYDVTTVNSQPAPAPATKIGSGDITDVIENSDIADAVENRDITGVLEDSNVIDVTENSDVIVETSDNNAQSSNESIKLYDVNNDVNCTSYSVEDNSVNVHLNQNLNIPSNTLMTISVEVNKKIKDNADLLIYPNVIKKSVVLASVLTHTKSSNVTIQLANLSNEGITLKTGTKLSEGIYIDNEHVTIAQLEKPSQYNCTKLPPLAKKDINCDNAQVHDAVLEIANKYRDACWLPDEPLGKYKGDILKIELKENTVVNRPQYRIPYAFQKQLDSKIDQMLKEGIISHSSSNFNSPLLIVQRANQNDIRICVDYRQLNSIIQPVCYPLPRVSDVLNAVGNKPFMSSLDLVAAYHQLQIHEPDKEKTAFSIRGSKFHFNVVPFGLQSSPAFFARVINDVMYKILGPQCMVYLDDIILFSDTIDEHLQIIAEVLETLQHAGLKLKLPKCTFFANEINFLGYQLSKRGMSMNEVKINALKKMPMPNCKKQLQAFLGAVNYFRIFIPNFAELAEPLYLLLRKQSKFVWSDHQSNAVESIKNKLIQAPILKMPDFHKPFIIFSDASNVGIGAVLMQAYDDVLHPLAYVSKTLDSAQRNYSTTKKEALALVYAVEQFRYVILTYPLFVFTDHKPLIGALKQPTKDQCLQRWAMLIQEYEPTIHYIEGKDNNLADLLSRIPVNEDLSDDLNTRFHKELLYRSDQYSYKFTKNNENCYNIQDYIPEKTSWSEQELLRAQRKDEACQALLKSVKNESNEKINNNPPFILSIRILRDVVYIVRKIKRGNLEDQYLVPYVPDSLMPQAFELIHTDSTAGHNGPERTLKRFKQNFYNHQEVKLIEQFCNSCELCIMTKSTPKPVPIKRYPVPTKPFHTITSDILGPLSETEKGHKYILTIRDYTTRYTILFPLVNKSTDQIIDALRNVIANFGPSNVLVTDNAQEYVSEKLKLFLKNYNTKKVEISVHHPQSQGLSERINKEINKLLRIYTTQYAIHDWDTLLPTIQLCINSTYNSSLQETPFFALFAHDPSTSALNPPKLNYAEDELNQHLKRVSAIRQHCRDTLLKMQERYTDYTNTKRKTKIISAGDRVYAKLKQKSLSKLDCPISGPFLVESRRQNAWNLRELSTQKLYVVHPDQIITRKHSVNDIDHECTPPPKTEITPPHYAPDPDSNVISESERRTQPPRRFKNQLARQSIPLSDYRRHSLDVKTCYLP